MPQFEDWLDDLKESTFPQEELAKLWKAYREDPNLMWIGCKSCRKIFLIHRGRLAEPFCNHITEGLSFAFPTGINLI